LVESVLTPPPLVLVIVALLAVVGFFGVQKYQRCPHCGRIVPRAVRGWLRCAGCGRQYRKGLRVR
jgi:tRNA(Ile2) C34 agmatinyltransferase TiaS